MKPLINFLGVFCLVHSAVSQCRIWQIECGSICATPCDGFVECADRSDETYDLCSGFVCNSNSTNNGAENFNDFLAQPIVKFKCDYGGCISETFKCNGSPDCWDGSDETSKICSSQTCSRREFRCNYGACIRKLWSCNGNKNCADMSDETEELCRSKRCRSTQFKCRYGACIPKDDRCDGKSNCIDNSDESEEECGAGHTTKLPPLQLTSTPAVVSPPSKQSTKNPEVILNHSSHTTPRQTEDSGILFTERPTLPTDWCKEQGLCSCPQPNEHFCVPCNKAHSCDTLGDGALCSIKPAGGPFSQVEVEVLSCGGANFISLAGFVRNNEVPYCGSSEGVPAGSIVLANCWGTYITAECSEDGTWNINRSCSNSISQSPTLCQFQEMNSPVCGQRPKFAGEAGRTVHRAAHHKWPWMVGLKQDGTYFCTANIISPHYLLTAAHCVTRTQEDSEQLLNPHDVKIQRVSAEGRIVKDRISEIHLHPQFTGGLQPFHDVALLRMEKEIFFSHQVYPACVHKEHFPAHHIAATFNRTLNEYKWELIIQRHDPRCHSPHDLCATSLGIDSYQFCGKDVEFDRNLPDGSSGGPYLVNIGNDADERWVIAGIVSSYHQKTSCNLPVTIFTSVRQYWPWISKCVQTNVCD